MMNEQTNKCLAQSWFKFLFVTTILLMVSSLAAFAQDESVPPEPPEPGMAIRGTIRTCAGVPLAGVVVVIEGSGSLYTRVTNASGVYSATLLPIDDYVVTPTPTTGYFFSPQSVTVSNTNLAVNFTRYRRDNRANFDGDCRTDISVFNRGSGEWRSLNSSNGALVSFFFGQSADILTPGDYNADGRTDRAVFRPGNATWYVATDTSGNFYGFPFGVTGDIPVARDYDGDAKTDVAVFRPGNATWYILNSTDNSVSIVQFGVTGDHVVPGDYDGDGRADIAVFRHSDATWYIRRQDGTFYGIPFGVTGDWQVPADYDGDGKTDIAVWRPSNGFWYILNSSNGVVQYIQWGETGDRPVPGDYDGDGRADAAIQRPNATGTWYILYSSGGSAGVNFDFEFPVPGGYLYPLYW